MEPISKLLKQHDLSDIRAINTNGDTVLHLVVKNEKFSTEVMIEILKNLLQKGVNPNIKNRDEETVLHLSIMSRKKEIIDFLITQKVYFDNSIAEYIVKNENEIFEKLLDDLQMSDSDMHKAESESSSFVEWILSKKLFDIDYLNCYGQSALILALRFNLHHLLPVFLKHTNDINYVEPETKRTLLHIFLENNGHLRQRYGPSNNVFYEANKCRLYPGYLRRHAKDVVETMLARGISPDALDAYGSTSSNEAISRKENIYIIGMLIDASTEVNRMNSDGQTPFHQLIDKWSILEEWEIDEYFRILRILIARSVDVNQVTKCGMSPLHYAVKNQNLLIVEFLRKHGANFIAITEGGETSLHLLVKKFNADKIENETQIKLFDMLINSGCKVDAKDNTGKTALHIVVNDCNVRIARKLIGYGANVNCKNNLGETPLCCLATYKYTIYPAQVLLNCRIHENVIEFQHVKAQYAEEVRKRHPRNIMMLKFLLKYGANFDAHNDAGYTALRMALWKNYNEGKCKDSQVGMHELPSFINCIKKYPSSEVVILLNHWIKLKVANLECDTGYEYTDLMKKQKYKKIDNECRKEIEKLKNNFIDERTSVYDFVHMNLNNSRAYLKNEKLQVLIQSSKLEEEFPEYSVLIFSNYQEIVTRKLIINKAKIVLLEFTMVHLPEVCSELIFSFFNNAELYYFIGN